MLIQEKAMEWKILNKQSNKKNLQMKMMKKKINLKK